MSHASRFVRPLRLAWFAWLVLPLAWGCGAPPAEPVAPDGRSGQAPPQPEAAGNSTWDAVFMQGKKIGYARTVLSVTGSADQVQTHTRSVSRFKVARGGELIEVEMKLASVRGPEGQVMRMESESSLGTGLRRAQFMPDGAAMLVRVLENGREESSTVAWSSEIGDWFAVEQSLRDEPLLPGRERQLNMWLPLLETVGRIRLVAGKREPTALLYGTFDLLRIEQTAELPDNQQLQFVLWTDERGEILKTVDPASGQETYRTTQEVAEREETAPDLDLLHDAVVKLDRPLANPRTTRRAVYKVRLPDSDPAELLVSDAWQQVEPLDARTAQVTVAPGRPGAADPSRRPPPAAQHAPPETLSPSSLVQSDDPAVQRLAGSVAADSRAAWEIACQLEALVGRYITEKDYSQVFASASEVIATRRGDCTEHAVLLAALCRARGIPARAAVGLVYEPALGGFAYHMWSEVWIDGQWYPLDATRPQGGIGAGYLKLGHSTLNGPAAFASFLPVVKALGRLEVVLLRSDGG